MWTGGAGLAGASTVFQSEISCASSGTDRLELRYQRREEFRREGAVDDPMVDGDRDPCAAAGYDLAIDHHRSRLDGAEGHHAALRRIDDRRAGFNWSAGADVGDGDGPTTHLAGWQRPAAGTLDQLGALFGDRAQVESVCATQARHQQSLLGIDRDPEVDRLLHDDLVAALVPRAIH